MSEASAGAAPTDWYGLDDEILIKAHLRGDEHAFEVLFKKHRDRIARLVFSIVKDEDLAEDIVQEVFLLVYRSLPRFRGDAAFKTWIYRIAVNEAVRQAQLSKRWKPLPEDYAEEGTIPSMIVVLNNGDSPERLMVEGQQRALIHQALDALKPPHRAILTMHYLEDLSVEEIARILEIPQGSVKSRLFYARENLKKALQPLLGDFEAAGRGSHAL
ncbi:MAG: sigma-70 family RNA polymerase sigma factor [Candidatus Lambdaproteobacteria bacterium]|nr:sigma-70 family RNA polymerase sigma factor [Candidatus Lambdaproteobacteria bacterium]